MSDGKQDKDKLIESSRRAFFEIEEIRKAVGMAPSLLATNTAAIISLILEIETLRDEQAGAVEEFLRLV